MAAEKAPAFQFYPKDFMTDGNVVRMTLQERGAYITLLCLCWTDLSLPADMGSLARSCGVSTTAFTRLWPALAPCFTVTEGRLMQPRIERERQKQETYRALKAEAGRKGGRPKATSKQKKAQVISSLSTIEAKESPPSSSSSSFSDLPSSSSVSDLQFAEEVMTLQPGSTTIPRAHKPALVGDERFRQFWLVYPNKKGKDDALKAWQKRNPSAALTELIVAAVVRQTQWADWTKDGGRFIPHPSTWLNRGSWDDEPTAVALSLVSDIGRQNAANGEMALQIMEERDAVQR